MKFGPLNIPSYKPYIIAEAGVNHECKINLASKYIDLCKKYGADAIKFQTYKAETIASKFSPAYWDLSKEKCESQYKLFKKYDKFEYDDYKFLKKKCDRKKILFMTTLFDTESVNLFDNLIKIYKISSSDITNYPLLHEIGLKKKHVLLSTGGASIKEIKKAKEVLNLPDKKICIMHCILNYPTNPEHANLLFIKKLKKIFYNNMIGYSDHVSGDSNLTQIQVAYDLGAKIVEKHFTHNKKKGGNDHYHSMDIKDLERFNLIMNLKRTLKGKELKNLNNERKSIKFARRGIYAKIDIKKGDRFNAGNLIALRPQGKISSEKWFKIFNKISNYDIPKGKQIKL